MLLIVLQTPALVQHFAIPVQAEGFQGAPYVIGCAADFSRGVDIFYSQQPLPLL